MENPADTLKDLLVRASAMVTGMAERNAIHRADDAALAEAIATAADFTRLMEGVLVEGVAEVAERSRSRDTDRRLTTRLGCRNVNELIQRLTRCSSATAARLDRAQRAVAAVWDPLTDEERPATLPALREALLGGHVGVDGVLAIAGPLLEMRDRVARDRVLLADDLLAGHARGEGPDDAPPASADVLRVHAQVWATALDEDGAEPRERDIAFRRGITLGEVRNGMIPIRGALLPDVAAQFQRIIDATSSTNTRDVCFADSEQQPVEDVGILDDRTRPQRRHDAFALALDVAARSGELPTIGGAAPTRVVMTRADDLTADSGWATVEGCDEPVAQSVARHAGCAGVVQRVAVGPNGRIQRIGIEERLFNRHQRRGIALRDGACVIPSCGVPAGWCEIHHVTDYAEGGPTHTDNGVLLCWSHHRFIDTGPWKVRMNRGAPEVQAPRWFDPTGRWRPVTRSRIRMLDLIGRRT